MATPFVDELVRRLRMDCPGLDVDIRPGGAATVRWESSRVDSPLTLYVHEGDLEVAVTELGQNCRDQLWPGSSVEAAGFNLLLVHLDEVLATRDISEPLRITRQGLVWPTDLRED
jgi:hypothetical protein